MNNPFESLGATCGNKEEGTEDQPFSFTDKYSAKKAGYIKEKTPRHVHKQN